MDKNKSLASLSDQLKVTFEDSPFPSDSSSSQHRGRETASSSLSFHEGSQLENAFHSRDPTCPQDWDSFLQMVWYPVE